MFVVFSFSYSNNGGFKNVSFGKVSAEVIRNKQTIIPFTITGIEINSANVNDSFVIDENIPNVPNNYSKIQDLKITNITSGSKSGNKVINFNGKDTIKFDLSGKLILSPKDTEQTKVEIAIGHKIDTYSKFVSLNLTNYITFISHVEVKVNRHMDLGIGIAGAGTTLDTRNNGGYALVEVTGEAGKNIKLSIVEPQNIKISNGKDSLPVEVAFANSTEPHIFKQTIPRNNNDYTNAIENIKIHGKCTATANSRGTYTGSFIVRVEYND